MGHVVAASEQPLGDRTADEAGAPNNQDVHGRIHAETLREKYGIDIAL